MASVKVYSENGQPKDVEFEDPDAGGKEDGTSQKQEIIPHQVLQPFVNHQTFPFTHRCLRVGCSAGSTTTIFGARSASIRKSEPCSLLCPFETCTMESNMTVPWRRVKVASVYEGAVPPEVMRALSIIAVIIFVIAVTAGFRSLGIGGIVGIAIAELIIVPIVSLLFRETYGEFTGKYMQSPDLLLARIPESATEKFFQESKSFMASTKTENVDMPVFVNKEFTQEKSCLGAIAMGQDTLVIKGDTGELYQSRTPCGISCLRAKHYHRFRVKDVMWTYGERSSRNNYVLATFVAIAILLFLGANSGTLVGIAFCFLIIGIVAYYLSASSAMTIGLPVNTMLRFAAPANKLPEISDAILSSQIQREVDKDPAQTVLEGHDLSQQVANLRVYPDHIRHTSTCNWRSNPCCWCCQMCCNSCATRLIMSMCGYSQLSGRFNKRTYIGASTAGNPTLLVVGVLFLIIGLVLAVALVVTLDGETPEAPWITLLVHALIAGLCIWLWWCSRKLLVSIGLKGTDVLARSGGPLGLVDITGVSSTVWFHPESVNCHALVENLDSLAECSVRREVLKNQRVASREKAPSSKTWIEWKSKDGEFYYEHANTGNTAWDVRPYDHILSDTEDASLSSQSMYAP
eukprot:gb/GECG01000982.1/.p1 GENE.gb/GECG01000982.1/~~gb/GECG01000982.1/.p1  ORF type:complete len:630 (+),score=50.79 gb/GECG01000982.1/:1-1890(+)